MTMKIKIKKFAASNASFSEFEWIDRTKPNGGPGSEKLVLAYKSPSQILQNSKFVDALNEILIKAKSIPTNFEFILSYEYLTITESGREVAKLDFYNDERNQPDLKAWVVDKMNEPVDVHKDTEAWKDIVRQMLILLGIRFK